MLQRSNESEWGEGLHSEVKSSEAAFQNNVTKKVSILVQKGKEVWFYVDYMFCLAFSSLIVCVKY